ncbi:CLUMA_CG000577, isoform A [Clunio marinus]|uniref:CLUMA_CG000577, isoform A n=1 Tax=Clunio marinus TaxID=568069 RepID=A0A1J1HFH5_9DIPT|nr:CLUMA_CG000577, isoform A [Clunio marinus]
MKSYIGENQLKLEKLDILIKWFDVCRELNVIFSHFLQPFVSESLRRQSEKQDKEFEVGKIDIN